MKVYYNPGKNSCPTRTLFLLLSLFASTSFTPSEYPECGGGVRSCNNTYNEKGIFMGEMGRSCRTCLTSF